MGDASGRNGRVARKGKIRTTGIDGSGGNSHGWRRGNDKGIASARWTIMIAECGEVDGI